MELCCCYLEHSIQLEDFQRRIGLDMEVYFDYLDKLPLEVDCRLVLIELVQKVLQLELS
jgi:hypothetical protein